MNRLPRSAARSWAMVLGLLEDPAVKDDLRREAPDGLHLDRVGPLGHDDRHRHVEEASRVGDREGVVSGRGRHHSLGPLLVGQAVHEVDAAPDLEGNRGQMVFVLDEDLGAQELVELRIAVEGRPGQVDPDDLPGLQDILKLRPGIFHGASLKLSGFAAPRLRRSTSASRYGKSAGVPPVCRKMILSSWRKRLRFTRSTSPAIAFPV